MTNIATNTVPQTCKRYDSRILGKNSLWSNDSRETGLNSNILILGTSGCGKTGSILYHNLKLLKEQSAVICDSKGLLYGKFKDQLTKKGYNVQMINLVDPSRSTCGWNPVEYLTDLKGNISAKSVLKFAETLLPIRIDDREPVWMQGAQTIWSMLTSWCIEGFPEEDHNINAILKLYHSFTTDAGMAALAKWSDENPDTICATKYSEFKANLEATKMTASYFGFINGMCNSLSLPELNDIFGRKECIDLRSIGKTKTALFVVTPDTDHTMDAISSLLYAQIIQQNIMEADSTEEGRVAVPINLFLDDFANATIPDFDMTISVTRSRDIGITVMIQSLSQLNSKYGKESANTIVNNMDTIVFLGNNDISTAEYIATRASKTTNSILCMDRRKEYILVSGEQARLVDKLAPYSDQETYLEIGA